MPAIRLRCHRRSAKKRNRETLLRRASSLVETTKCSLDDAVPKSPSSYRPHPQSVSADGAPNFREQDSLVAQFYEPKESG